MSKRFFALAFAAGLAVLAWVAYGFIGTSWLALTMTAVIAAVYLLGARELQQFRGGTSALDAALADITQPLAALDGWLERVPANLRQVVRLRIEGERSALPGPALTPYLVGLLVMLGMLGTFLGMVVTFKGAVFALEGSTDLQAIRGALAAPIRGLGLAFGTSVAGVAASAMLGAMSAISRRERLDVARQLDGRIATVLRPFSLAQQRHEAFRALQDQAVALPQVVQRLDAMMERIEQRSQQLDQQLLERQAELQRAVTQAYDALAREVGTSLADNLAAGTRAAGEAIGPVVESAMQRIVQQSDRLHARLGDVAQGQVEVLSEQFGQRSAQLLGAVNDALARSQAEQAAAERQRLQDWTGSLHALAADLQQQWRGVGGEVAGLLGQSEDLVRARSENEALWVAQHGERMDQLAGLWRTELAALRHEESRRGEAAVARLAELEAAVAGHLATLGAALEAPLTRLLQTAAEVPQAAAGVMAQLRQEMSRVAERDNAALQERTLLLERLTALLHSVDQATGAQRGAIEAMVASAAAVLEQANGRFVEAVQAQAAQAADLVAQASGSAVELASVAEAFGASVQQFQASNDKLAASLQNVEASLHKSTARSDEQLAYYVAQAREVIDLTLSSQQGLVDNLRQLQGQAAGPALAERGA